jgi:hypothetical protein
VSDEFASGQDGPNEESPTPFYKRWWFIAIAVVAVLGVIANLGEDSDDEDTVAAVATTTSTSAEPPTSEDDPPTTTEGDVTTTSEARETTTTAAPTTTTTAAPATTSTTLPPEPEPVFGSGIQVVGEDVRPAIYETGLLGEDIFDGCYWERLSGLSGEFDDIIANNNAVVHDVVEIAGSDTAFDSDCDSWYELTPLDEPLTAIPQGKWVVGVHFQPGTYQADGGETCYWERLSGVSGEFDDIVANDLPSGTAIVEISSNDYAFNSSGCREWTIRGS